jgi:nucleolar protein 9
MPRENKNRGRREEKKLKRKAEATENIQNKRQKADELLDELRAPPAENALSDNVLEGEEEVKEERPFYGMLADEEQEYFRRADEMLELNDFPSPEDRSLFLASVYREADSKELKIACSQSCSRLMERLILLSTPDQKKQLFEKFSGNFAHLVQHRFASHCCETLFVQSAGLVTEELIEDTKKEEIIEGGEPFVSMENLFLFTLNELEGDMTFLLTNRFASHTLRVLLIILSGRPLEKSSTKTVLQSKKKEKIGITGLDTSPTEFTLNKRAVPESFSFAVSKIISDTIGTMDEAFIRVLATHPTGNPTLQVLLELELTSKSTSKSSKDASKTILSTLLPDDISVEGSESSVFINGLLYDAIGSRLLETICTHAPGKLFKQIYKAVFKDRIGGLARNEIASYVMIRVLERLSKEDLEDAVTAMIPQIPGLIERHRTVILKILIERCQARGADVDTLTAALATAYGSDPSSLVLKMACINDLPSLTAAVLPPPAVDGEEATPAPSTIPKPTPAQLHGSLLAQTMLATPGAPQELLQSALFTLPPQTILTLALYTPTSHLLQAALLPTPPSAAAASTNDNKTTRRKLLSTLLIPSQTSNHPASDPPLALALSNVGTHVLDSILLSAPTLLSLIERVATALEVHEAELRDSFTGRIVWRNWAMDLYKRRRGEWVKKVQGISTSPPAAGLTSKPASATPAAVFDVKKDSGKEKNRSLRKDRKKEVVEDRSGKTAIQLAREKFARQKVEKERRAGNRGTGANGIMT